MYIIKYNIPDLKGMFFTCSINIFFILNYNGSCVHCFPTHNFAIKCPKNLKLLTLHDCLTFLNK